MKRLIWLVLMLCCSLLWGATAQGATLTFEWSQPELVAGNTTFEGWGMFSRLGATGTFTQLGPIMVWDGTVKPEYSGPWTIAAPAGQETTYYFLCRAKNKDIINWTGSGQTTSAGAANGTTVIDSGLNAWPDGIFVGGTVTVGGVTRPITGFTSATGTITVGTAFAAQVASGATYTLAKSPLVMWSGDSNIVQALIDLKPPTVPVVTTTIPQFVPIGTFTLNGTKEAGSSIWINGSEIVPANTATTWTATLNVVKGANSYTISSKDAAPWLNQSATTSVTFQGIEAPAIPVNLKVSITAQ